jgi:two-component system chemotaxis response regulator CheY
MRGLMNILLIEDDADDARIFIKVASHVFSRELNITHVENGQLAINLLNSDAPAFNLIISDYNMPIMDGLSFLQQAGSLIQNIPVVLLTSHIDTDFNKQAQQLGASAVFLKSNDLAQMSSALIHMLDYATAQPFVKVT